MATRPASRRPRWPARPISSRSPRPASARSRLHPGDEPNDMDGAVGEEFAQADHGSLRSSRSPDTARPRQGPRWHGRPHEQQSEPASSRRTMAPAAQRRPYPAKRWSGSASMSRPPRRIAAISSAGNRTREMVALAFAASFRRAVAPAPRSRSSAVAVPVPRQRNHGPDDGGGRSTPSSKMKDLSILSLSRRNARSERSDDQCRSRRARPVPHLAKLGQRQVGHRVFGENGFGDLELERVAEARFAPGSPQAARRCRITKLRQRLMRHRCRGPSRTPGGRASSSTQARSARSALAPPPGR